MKSVRRQLEDCFCGTLFESLRLIVVKRRLKLTFVTLVVLVVVIQIPTLFRRVPTVVPGHDVLAKNLPPPEIVSTMRAACYDCHSYETRWPWYGYVAPVSWWLDSHVNDARERLNFSEWPHDDAKKAARRWNDISDSVNDGDMPLPSYTKMHPAARLTENQRNALSNWAAEEADRLKATLTNAP